MRGTGRLALVVGLIVALGAAAQAVTIDWVTVGDAGNASDTRHYDPGYGAVADPYRIGMYEITAGQYTEFLNAVAASDPHGLYSTSMWAHGNGCKILQSGPSGIYSYSVAADRADRPVNFVSFWDAARFANWMHNGQPTGAPGPGTTEDGAYINVGNQATFARQPGARFYIPTEDQWYKAAYYKGGGLNAGYWEYQTQNDTTPTCEAPPGGSNSANHYLGVGSFPVGSPYWMSEVGAYTASAGTYGTFDQGGNVWEWNETVYATDNRIIRGGSWYDWGSDNLAAVSSRMSYTPPTEWRNLGFRLASPSGPDVIPEPATVSLFAIAAAAMLRRRRRRG